VTSTNVGTGVYGLSVVDIESKKDEQELVWAIYGDYHCGTYIDARAVNMVFLPLAFDRQQRTVTIIPNPNGKLEYSNLVLLRQRLGFRIPGIITHYGYVTGKCHGKLMFATLAPTVENRKIAVTVGVFEHGPGLKLKITE
jgi:hypothetical protein